MQDDRYSRQILFDKIGKAGQEKIFNSNILIIGCGALGSVIANNLVRSGVGKITIVDRDFVELNNLQRQILFDEKDARLKLPKAIAAKKKLREINSQIVIEAKTYDVNHKNIEKLINGVNIVLDGTDNMETRFIINDACLKKNIPWIYGSVICSVGMTMNIIPEKTPCLKCIVSHLPPPGALPTCDTIGILNTIPGIIASTQCTEALKILISDDSINERLIYIDIWNNTFKNINVNRNHECSSCGKREFTSLKAEEYPWITVLCGRNSVQIVPQSEINIDLKELEEKWKPIGKAIYNGYLLSFKVDSYELIVFPNGRVIIKGTTDLSIAKTLYAKYIGT